jgi:hypothetical protein
MRLSDLGMAKAAQPDPDAVHAGFRGGGNHPSGGAGAWRAFDKVRARPASEARPRGEVFWRGEAYVC